MKRLVGVISPIYSWEDVTAGQSYLRNTISKPQGDVKKEPKGRLGFFKRLSYRRGSPVARYEDIIIAVA